MLNLNATSTETQFFSSVVSATNVPIPMSQNYYKLCMQFDHCFLWPHLQLMHQDCHNMLWLHITTTTVCSPMSASRAVYYVLDNSLVTAPLLLMPDSDNKRAKEFSVHFTLSTHSCLSTSSNHQFELSLGATPPNQDCVSMHIPAFFIFPKPRLSILNFCNLRAKLEGGSYTWSSCTV